MFWTKDGRTHQEAKAKASFYHWKHPEQIPQRRPEVTGIRGESGPGADGGLPSRLPVLLLLLPLWRPDPGWLQPPRWAPVQLDHSEARTPPQARRPPSQRGGGWGGGGGRGGTPRTGAEENQTPPHHLHRGAAGRSGGAFPAESVPRCEHEGEASAADTPERGKSGGDDSLCSLSSCSQIEIAIFCMSYINFVTLRLLIFRILKQPPLLFCWQVWFKNRRAKWRRQKRSAFAMETEEGSFWGEPGCDWCVGPRRSVFGCQKQHVSSFARI